MAGEKKGLDDESEPILEWEPDPPKFPGETRTRAMLLALGGDEPLSSEMKNEICGAVLEFDSLREVYEADVPPHLQNPKGKKTYFLALRVNQLRSMTRRPLKEVLFAVAPDASQKMRVAVERRSRELKKQGISRFETGSEIQAALAHLMKSGTENGGK